MDGVQRGDIKKLLVLELLPKQVNFSGGPDLVSWLGTFSLERVLGTVPGRRRWFGLLRSPGLPTGVLRGVGRARHVGPAHAQLRERDAGRDDQLRRVPRAALADPRGTGETAAAGAAAPAEPDRAVLRACPDVVDFPRDIQPILDRHCVACHNYQRRDGGVLLTGDLGAAMVAQLLSAVCPPAGR